MSTDIGVPGVMYPPWTTYKWSMHPPLQNPHLYIRVIRNTEVPYNPEDRFSPVEI